MCQRDTWRSFGDPVATFSRILVEVNAGRGARLHRLGGAPVSQRIARFAEPVSSNHYDIDISVKTFQHAIHALFSGPGLARGDDGMDEDI
jgi:hypothetical protein